MARARGMIEIRMDRRQAFYAVVGSLLIVSVAFVVGLIVGQRMQLLDGGEGPDPGSSGTHAEDDGLEVALREEPDNEPGYTFYEELRADAPRPLLMPSQDGIGEPVTALRLLDRDPPANPAEGDAEPERTPPPAAAPAPAPPVEPAPAAPSAPEPAPERAPIAPLEEVAVAPREASAREAPFEGGGAPRMARRAVRTHSEGSGPREFGFFTVEAGRFDSFGDATDRRNQLRSGGHEAIVTIVAPNDGPREYRVQIGSYTSRGDADSVAAAVGRLGISARVVQEG